jgi:hypothetical protein
MNAKLAFTAISQISHCSAAAPLQLADAGKASTAPLQLADAGKASTAPLRLADAGKASTKALEGVPSHRHRRRLRPHR